MAAAMNILCPSRHIYSSKIWPHNHRFDLVWKICYLSVCLTVSKMSRIAIVKSMRGVCDFHRPCLLQSQMSRLCCRRNLLGQPRGENVASFVVHRFYTPSNNKKDKKKHQPVPVRRDNAANKHVQKRNVGKTPTTKKRSLSALFKPLLVEPAADPEGINVGEEFSGPLNKGGGRLFHTLLPITAQKYKVAHE